MALVAAAHEIQDQLGFRFHIGHVNHALRGRESEQDAQFVRRLAGHVGWPFHAARRPIKKGNSGNLEARARVQRYEALIQMAKRYRLEAVFTAHTGDDQVETICMNLLRGTGPEGLSGMPPVRTLFGSSIPVCRPFLDVTRNDVVSFLKKRRLGFRFDKTNRDPRLLRNWLRSTLLPLLEARAPGFKKRLSNLAAILRDEELYWDQKIEKLKGRLLKPFQGGWLLDFEALLRYSAAVQRRFLRTLMGGNVLTFEGVEGLRRWMQSPPTGGRVWQLRKGWMAERLSKSKGSPSATLFWLGQSRKRQSKSKRGR